MLLLVFSSSHSIVANTIYKTNLNYTQNLDDLLEHDQKYIMTSDFANIVFARNFNYGDVNNINDQLIREFVILITDHNIVEKLSTSFNILTLDNINTLNSIIRATQDDIIQINFINTSKYSYALHFHDVYNDEKINNTFVIEPGNKLIYELVSSSIGIHSYNYHLLQLEDSFEYEIYGIYIIDPTEGRKKVSDEIVLITTRSDVLFNNIYTMNTSFYHQNNFITINTLELIRIYVTNIMHNNINHFH